MDAAREIGVAGDGGGGGSGEVGPVVKEVFASEEEFEEERKRGREGVERRRFALAKKEVDGGAVGGEGERTVVVVDMSVRAL